MMMMILTVRYDIGNIVDVMRLSDAKMIDFKS